MAFGIVLIGLTGCTALNSDFSEVGSDSAASTSTGAAATTSQESTSGKDTDPGGTRGGTSLDPTEPRTSSGTSGTSGDTEGPTSNSTTSVNFDVGKSDSSGQAETGMGPVTLVWLSYSVNGNFFATGEDFCAPSISALGPNCLGDHHVLVGTADQPFETLPDEFAFLAGGPLHVPGSGTVVADDFEALVLGNIDAALLVDELTGGDQEELAVWRGPTAEGDVPSCDDWMQLTGDANTYSVAAGMGVSEIAPCSLLLPTLCACSGTL